MEISHTNKILSIVARHSGYSVNLAIEEFKSLCEAYNIIITEKRTLKNNLLVIYSIIWEEDTIEKFQLVFNRIVMTSTIYHVIQYFEFDDIEKLSISNFTTKIEQIKFENHLNKDCSFAVRCSHLGIFKDLKNIKNISNILEKKIADPIIRKTKAKVKLENPIFVIKSFISAEGDFLLAKKLFSAQPRKTIEKRTPSRRKFFHPSAMRVPLARTLVNLTGLIENETFYDPFNGSGGLLLEASNMEMNCIGQDMDKWMLRGAKENIEYFDYNTNLLSLICGDSTQVVLRKETIDGIATDPPYGTASTITSSNSTLNLVFDFFNMASQILKPGKKIVICTPDLTFENELKENFELVSSIRIRIHRSLTRKISILKKIEK